jgi:hypothetical protein
MQRTCLQQAGFFGSDFWERLVLQAAYHEPAIRHAIVAIGSLHEVLEHRIVIKDADKVFAFEQYSLAMKELLLPLSQNGERAVDVCLIACILFTCFEVWMSRFYAVIVSRYLFVYANFHRIYKGTMRWQELTSEVVQSSCVRSHITLGKE